MTVLRPFQSLTWRASQRRDSQSKRKKKKMNETLKNECELLRTRANLFISLIVGFFGLQWFSSFTLARTLATVGTH
jgi:hypothetical protein